jgi:hypothetical protein
MAQAPLGQEWNFGSSVRNREMRRPLDVFIRRKTSAEPVFARRATLALSEERELHRRPPPRSQPTRIARLAPTARPGGTHDGCPWRRRVRCTLGIAAQA